MDKLTKIKWIIVYAWIVFALIYLTVGNVIIRSEALKTYYRFSNVPILIYNGTSLGFQVQNLEYLRLKAVTGNINTSVNDLHVYYGGGYFIFEQNETVNLEAYTDIDNVKYRTTSLSGWRALENGESLTVNANETANIQWSTVIRPVLPITFILGMIGLGAMFAGPLFAVQQIKKKNYREGLIAGISLTAIGLGLFLSWL